jgi:hypothetical protein
VLEEEGRTLGPDSLIRPSRPDYATFDPYLFHIAELTIQTPKTRSALHDVVTREYTIHLHKRVHDCAFKKSGFISISFK